MKAKADWLDPKMHHHCIEEYDVVLVGPKEEVDALRYELHCLRRFAKAYDESLQSGQALEDTHLYLRTCQNDRRYAVLRRTTSPEKP